MEEIKVKKIKPMFTALVTTMNRFVEDSVTEGGIIDPSKTKGAVKQYQTVLAIGDCVKNIKVGDVVSINPQRYAIKKHNEGSLKNGVISDNPTIGYNFDVLEVNDAPCLLLQDRDINYVIEEYELIDKPVSKIIKPAKKKILYS